MNDLPLRFVQGFKSRPAACGWAAIIALFPFALLFEQWFRGPHAVLFLRDTAAGILFMTAPAGLIIYVLGNGPVLLGLVGGIGLAVFLLCRSGRHVRRRPWVNVSPSPAPPPLF
ncbi:MAG: hypothetical protein M5R36_15905 [Deltaproteobacteria bacterium]|nr:hypothetical protein [Deltaproteobacteria bacterium]